MVKYWKIVSHVKQKKKKFKNDYRASDLQKNNNKTTTKRLTIDGDRKKKKKNRVDLLICGAFLLLCRGAPTISSFNITDAQQASRFSTAKIPKRQDLSPL